MIDLGAKFAWFFTYMPVGKGAVIDILISPEQREMMYHKLREYRNTKPLFIIDSWNDGEYVEVYVDNIFLHHTNEIAQSEAYVGHKWFHVHHCNDQEGEVSKSKGDFLTVSLVAADAI